MTSAVLAPPQPIAPPQEPPPQEPEPPDGTRPLEESTIPGLTPVEVYKWLNTFADPEAAVGESHGSISCPLANFARHRLGLLQPAVCSYRLTYTQPPPPEEDLGTTFWPRVSVPLPTWAKSFVLHVDHCGYETISARMAKDILRAVS